MKSMQMIRVATAIWLVCAASSTARAQGNMRERIREMQRRRNSDPQAKLSTVPNTMQKSFDFEGITRTFLVHVAPAYDGQKVVPLVLGFHGGLGTGKQVEQTTGFSPLADKENFIVVYPDGHNNQWNDERGSGFSGVPTANDVGFVTTLLAYLQKNYRIDPKRIYATGVSNGGILTNRLGVELSERFAAIAPVVGNLPIDPNTGKPFAPEAARQKPLSVLMINGTADPLVPWEGGRVKGSSGRVTSVAATVAAWVKLDGCKPQPEITNLPDKFPDDATTLRRESYRGGQNGTEVVLYAVVGGGHGWHGSNDKRLSGNRNLAGKLSREINATEVIWEFFKRHAKK